MSFHSSFYYIHLWDMVGGRLGERQLWHITLLIFVIVVHDIAVSWSFGTAQVLVTDIWYWPILWSYTFLIAYVAYLSLTLLRHFRRTRKTITDSFKQKKTQRNKKSTTNSSPLFLYKILCKIHQTSLWI